MNRPLELLRRYSDLELASALKGREVPVRALSKSFLRVAAARAGITRIGQIGGFVDSGIEVAQTARPNLWDHAATGMNTGSQGKGYSIDLAGTGAIMEALEAYCSEPRSANLIRGSYNSLRATHRILSPSHFVPADVNDEISDDDVQMWTTSLLWPDYELVLIPADLVYCVFHQSSYGCRAGFSCNSSGTAGGLNYTDALLRAILEYIERHYTYFLERNDVRVEALKIDGPIEKMMLKHSEGFLSEYVVQLYAIEGRHLNSHLPFVYCEIGNEDTYAVGYGLSLDPEVAIHRAYTEAFQCLVTNVSGARDDLTETSLPFIDDERPNWPTVRTLSFDSFSSRFSRLKKPARTSAGALKFLTNWVASIGFPYICFSNLTRVGIEIPIVKAHVPGMILCDRYRTEAPIGWTFDRVIRNKFLIPTEEATK